MSSEIKVDTISENTSANGVVIDSVTLKDGGVTATAASTITVTDNSDTLSLISTDADANVGPVLRLYRNSASAVDNDVIGNIIFSGNDTAGNETDYLTFQVNAGDADDGQEDGFMRILMPVASTSTEFVRLSPAEVVFNEGAADLDFRVEGDANTKILMADAGDNGVYFGNSGNTTPAQSSTAVHTFISAIGRMQISASSHAAITTNRVNSEGTTVEFRQAGGVRGSISVGGASTAFNTSSDYRLKENVDYTWDGTTILKQLKPAKFNWKVDPDNTIHGFIAHEAQAVVPDSVIGEKDAVDDNGDVAPQQIDQSKLVPILVKTIQELEARIKTLEDNQ